MATTPTAIRIKALHAWERERDEDLYGHRVMLLARCVDKISQRCQAVTMRGARCKNLADPLSRACPTHRRSPPLRWVKPEPTSTRSTGCGQRTAAPTTRGE